MSAWLQHRRLAGLLRTCWSVWLQRASRARAVRLAAALARRRHASQLLRTWHEEARHSALLCQAVSGAYEVLHELKGVHCIQCEVKAHL